MADRHELSAEQIEQYRTECYVVEESLFTEQEMQRVRDTVNELTDQAIASGEIEGIVELEPEPVDGRRVARRVLNPFQQHEVFRELATDERLMGRAQSLIGSDFGLHHSKLNMKPAKVGSVVEWHQDLAYFPHTNDDLITTLIYIDDATEENGCLQILPRHHTHYFDHRMPDGTFAGMITETIDDGRYGRPVALPAPAGSVIFMHPISPHSSLPNRSEKGRRTLIYEYRAADAIPLFYGQTGVLGEAFAVHLRGERARFARFGGPPPSIPVFAKQFQSLYKLQEQSRQAAGAGETSAG